MQWIKNSSLTLVLLALFLTSWAGHSVSGWLTRNQDLASHHQSELGYWEYVRSAEFGESTFENWESEFLQMALFVFLSSRLMQRGAAESRKPPGEEDQPEEQVRKDSPWPARHGGWVAKLYAHSLSITFAALFLGTWFLHAVTGASAFNDEQRQHGEPGVSVFAYVTQSRFWFESLQNWQSEFLATGSLVVLSIFLREKDSPESKPVTAPHAQTGT